MGLVHDLVEHVGPGLKEPEANTLGTCYVILSNNLLKCRVPLSYGYMRSIDILFLQKITWRGSPSKSLKVSWTAASKPNLGRKISKTKSSISVLSGRSKFNSSNFQNFQLHCFNWLHFQFLRTAFDWLFQEHYFRSSAQASYGTHKGSLSCAVEDFGRDENRTWQRNSDFNFDIRLSPWIQRD